jgi:hypothetical protein
MIELFRGTIIIVTREGDGHIIRVRRTTLRATTEVEYKAAAVELARLVPSEQRPALGLLLDLRDAPLLTEEVLEGAAMRAARNFSTGFPRTAVLVRTAVGALQAQRIGRGAGAQGARLCSDDAEAFAYLQGTGAPASGPMAGRRGGPASR